MRSVLQIALVGGAILSAAPAAADRFSDCGSAKPDIRIRACTEIIKFPKISARRIPQRDIALAYENRGAALADKGDHDLAVADYKTAFKLHPPDEDDYINRGIAYGKNGNHDRAIADFDKAIKLNSKHGNAYYNRGIASRDMGDHDRAIADFDKAIELNPKDANAYYNRGIAYQKKGEHDRAIADYDKASQEFSRRSLGLKKCSATLGLLVSSASPKQELSSSGNINWSDRTVCILALDAEKLKIGIGTKPEVQEFSRRGLSVEQCRETLGLPATGALPKPGLSGSANINWSDRTVCILALDAEKVSVGASTRSEVQEFSRRGLNVEKCRANLGLTTLSASPKPDLSSSGNINLSDRKSCILTLQAEQLDVGTSWRPEVREFSLNADLPL